MTHILGGQYNIFIMDEVIKKLKEHDKLFVAIDKRFEAVDRRFEAIDKRFDQVDKQIDLLARTVADHTDRFDRIEVKLEDVATKEDISKVMNTLDKIVGLYEKKDQELTMQAHNVKRLDDRVETLEKDVRRMKPALGLS